MPKGYDSNGNRTSSQGAKRKLTLTTRSGQFNVDLLTAERLLPLLELVMQEGGALRFGLTQDKGALAVGVYGLGDPQTKYVRSEDELDDLFNAIYHGFKGDLE